MIRRISCLQIFFPEANLREHLGKALIQIALCSISVATWWFEPFLARLNIDKATISLFAAVVLALKLIYLNSVDQTDHQEFGNISLSTPYQNYDFAALVLF